MNRRKSRRISDKTAGLPVENRSQPFHGLGPWVADASPRRLELYPRPVHLGFVVDKVALDRFLSEYVDFPCQYRYSSAPVVWMLAYFVYFRVQHADQPTLLDYADFMRRARWKSTPYRSVSRGSGTIWQCCRSLVTSRPVCHATPERKVAGWPTIRELL